MKRVQRYDAGTLAKPVRTPEGFLLVEGVIAKCGPLEYCNPDGSTRIELVTPEELFDQESMDSFAGVALTNTHPADLLTPQTVKQHIVGTVSAPRRDGELLISKLGILTADAIKDVEDGRAELSCGYSCDLDETPGTHPTYGAYHAIQRRRRGNHVAVVDEGRAGPQARIRLDSAGNACPPFATAEPRVVTSDPQASQPNTEIKPMPHAIKIDGLTFNVDGAEAPAVQSAIERFIVQTAQKLDAAEKAKATAEQERTAALSKFDALKANASKLVKGARAKLDAMMRRNVTCDECMGEKVDGSGGKCPSCDGAGSYSARDAIKAMPQPEGEPSIDEDVVEIEDELSREPAAEEALEKAANPEHADARASARKDAAKKRADARAAARQKRADGLTRRADRRAIARAALIVTAGCILGAEEKLDGLSDLDVKRKALGKIAPHLGDVAKMDAAAVEVLYTAEVKRADAAGGSADIVPAISPSDALRLSMTPPAGGNGTTAPRADAAQLAADAKANAWRNPLKQPTPAAK